MDPYLVWALVMFADAFSVLCGFYCVVKIFKRYAEGGDLFKVHGYFSAAFLLLLVFPLFTTIIGLKLIPEAPWGGAKIAAIVKAEGSIQVAPTWDTFNNEDAITLNIAGPQIEVPVRVSGVCSSVNGAACEGALSVSVPEEEVLLEQGAVIKLPITLYKQNLKVESAMINYTITGLDGRVYSLGTIEIKSSP